MPVHVSVCCLIEPLVLYITQTSSAAVSSHLPTPSLPLLLTTESIVTIQTPGSMASEASVTDEMITEKIETNVSGDISNADDMSLSETDDLKGKDEEEKMFETNVTDDVSNANEASLAKPEDLEVKDGEEKIEPKVSDDVSNADEPSLSKPEDLKGNDEEEKIETSVSDDISNADDAIPNPDDLKGKYEEEKGVQDSASVEAPSAETEENLEQKEEGTVIEEVKEAAIDESVSEPSVEAEEKEVMGKTDVPNTPESPKEHVEQPAEVSDASVTEDSIETPEEPSVSEILTEEAKSVEESSEVFTVPDSPLVTDDKPVELPTVGLVQEPTRDSNVTLNANETAEKSQEGDPMSQELPRNETSLSNTEDPINQVHEIVETISSEGIAIVPSIDEHKEIEAENIVPQLLTERQMMITMLMRATGNLQKRKECQPQAEVNVKNEEQDNTVTVENEVAGNSEEVKVSDGVGLIGEVKNENLEGEILNLYKNTRNIDLVEDEDSNKASSIDPSVTDEKPVEPPTVGLVQEPASDANVTLGANETAEKSQEGDPTSQELPRNETSPPITEDPISKVHETVDVESSEGIAIVPSIGEPEEIEEENIVPELPTEKTDDDHNADEGNKESAEEKEVPTTSVVKVSDTTAATEVPECAVQREVDVENEEKETALNVGNEVTGNTEEEKTSEGVVLIGEVKNECLEGGNLNSNNNTREIDLFGVEDSNNAFSIDPEHDPKKLDTELKQVVRQTLLDKMLEESAEDKKKETEKVDNQSLAQNTKDNSDTKTDWEVPKTDVSGKKSQSPQNSILSKVKKSIAKVKKAITVKSPSLKTMITEGINDTKAK
ncbi:hypothetical protein MUK42_09455 [Musa troglodytarum]|uniref:Uncharacterized protein n=1 Tax=Musa troglodytarum TaxID=320322 RepID=A0A9E7E970_9LILI|nr:hypothetical protein MUK42_09455 [Musa troglodytarum]